MMQHSSRSIWPLNKLKRNGKNQDSDGHKSIINFIFILKIAFFNHPYELLCDFFSLKHKILDKLLEPHFIMTTDPGSAENTTNFQGIPSHYYVYYLHNTNFPNLTITIPEPCTDSFEDYVFPPCN